MKYLTGTFKQSRLKYKVIDVERGAGSSFEHLYDWMGVVFSKGENRALYPVSVTGNRIHYIVRMANIVPWLLDGYSNAVSEQPDTHASLDSLKQINKIITCAVREGFGSPELQAIAKSVKAHISLN